MEYQRRVVCAANKCRISGHIVLGARHFDPLMRYAITSEIYASLQDLSEELIQVEKNHWAQSIQGFIDQHGVFMTRTEAFKVAEAAGQIMQRVGGDTTDGGTLYSENLY